MSFSGDISTINVMNLNSIKNILSPTKNDTVDKFGTINTNKDINTINSNINEAITSITYNLKDDLKCRNADEEIIISQIVKDYNTKKEKKFGISKLYEKLNLK